MGRPIGFRFKKRDIPSLAEVLVGVLETIRCKQGSTCAGMAGLCMFLRLLSFPCRYGDTTPRFANPPVPVISVMTNTVLDLTYDTYCVNSKESYRRPWPDEDVRCSHNCKRCLPQPPPPSLQNCFLFIDGKVRPIAWPRQRILSDNGHKRVLTLKFPSVVLPNGLTANMSCPHGKTWILCCQFSSSFKHVISYYKDYWIPVYEQMMIVYNFFFYFIHRAENMMHPWLRNNGISTRPTAICFFSRLPAGPYVFKGIPRTPQRYIYRVRIDRGSLLTNWKHTML